VITEAIVHHYGPDELLRRLAHPFWFQSFGAVMGMDRHSSEITTSVIGALKRGLAPLEQELGIHVCDRRGKHSRSTPVEAFACRTLVIPSQSVTPHLYPAFLRAARPSHSASGTKPHYGATQFAGSSCVAIPVKLLLLSCAGTQFGS
jgi:hypothetical protein